MHKVKKSYFKNYLHVYIFEECFLLFIFSFATLSIKPNAANIIKP